MSDYLDKWKNFLKEGAQWGGFTGGAAPLDEPTPDSGPIPPEQLRKMWSIYTEMGMSPEEILQTPEFVEAGIVSPEQLQEDGVRDTYGTEVEDRNKKSREKGAKEMGLKEGASGKCQKGYKTHKTRKTKKMYGKTYRNCVKAEGEDRELEEAMDPKKIKRLEDEYLRTKSNAILNTFVKLVQAGKYDKQRLFKLKKAAKKRNMSESLEELALQILDEKRKKKKKKKKKKKAKKDDRCTRIAKRKYDVWPSAYASGAVVQCRRGKIWKGLNEEEEKGLEIKIRKALRDEGGAAGMDALVKHTKASEKEIKDAIKDMDDVGRHEDGDYILADGEKVDILKEGWSDKYKRSIDCDNPKGFSQKAHCAGRKKRNEATLDEKKKETKKAKESRIRIK